MSVITGTVERVNFYNEVTGYAIVVVRTDGGRVGVKGALPQPRLGMTVTCEGDIDIHPKYGQQMTARSIQETVPRDLEGIEKYLASGLIDNIGPVYAKKIVDAFGENTLYVMDHEPERLLTIKGIGTKRAQAIIDSAKEQKAIRSIMIWLKKYDLSNAMAAKIYLTYGNDSIAKLEENPYRLADDIEGVGFKRADDVARRLGIPADSPFRIHSGIRAALAAAETAGNTFLPRESLLAVASGRDFLSLHPDLVDAQLRAGSIEDVVVSQDGDVALSRTRKAEKVLAQDIARLCSQEKAPIRCDVDAISRNTGLNYSDGQKRAITTALSSGLSVVTGGPGTGKTSITNAVISAMRQAGLRVLLAAPTGRAAKRMAEVTGQPAMTIHRLLEFGREGFARNRKNPLEGDALIVDETSMIDTFLARSLMSAVPDGMRVVLVGDMDQLPSIGPGCVLRDVIDSGTVPMERLTEIFRQARDSEIVMNAHRINHGRMPKVRNDIIHGNMFFYDKSERDDAARTVIRLATTGVANKFGFRPSDIQVLSPMRRPGDPLATSAINKEMQQILNPDGAVVARVGDQELRQGDRVMQTRNNYEKDIFNGDMGVVMDKLPPMEMDKAVMTVAFDGRTVRLTQQELQDVELAYACTIHKSQGMEYPVVIMPIHDSHYVMLKRNLIYTGITRASKMCILVGTKKAIATAVATEDTSIRHTRLKEKLREQLPVLQEEQPEDLVRDEGFLFDEDFGECPKITVGESRMLEDYGVPENNIRQMEATGETVLDGEIRRCRKEEYAGEPQHVRVSFGLRKENGQIRVFCPPGGTSSMSFEDAMRQGRLIFKKQEPSARQESPVITKKL